ncbi:M23 family metallopeptidase [Streptomyces sp. NPDC004822]
MTYRTWLLHRPGWPLAIAALGIGAVLGVCALVAANLPSFPAQAQASVLEPVPSWTVEQAQSGIMAQAGAQQHAALLRRHHTPVLTTAPRAPRLKPTKSSAPKPPPRKKRSDTKSVGSPPIWVLPVRDHRLSAGYGKSGNSWVSGHHTGIDFPVPSGTPVHCAGPGLVVAAGVDKAYGNQVVVRHTDGTYTQYAHLSRLEVHKHEHLRAGDEIGLSGATGNVTGAHLHFEARTAPSYGHDVDPIAWLRGRGVTL